MELNEEAMAEGIRRFLVGMYNATTDAGFAGNFQRALFGGIKAATREFLEAHPELLAPKLKK